jgi:hypothetical protein
MSGTTKQVAGVSRHIAEQYVSYIDIDEEVVSIRERIHML